MDVRHYRHFLCVRYVLYTFFSQFCCSCESELGALLNRPFTDLSDLFSPTPRSSNTPTKACLTVRTDRLTAIIPLPFLKPVNTIKGIYIMISSKKICFKAGLRAGATSCIMITTQCMKPLKVAGLKLWQFKGTGSHNIFRMVQSKVSVLVPLHVYALKHTRMQHISFGTAGEDNVEPWLV